jgi:hypothetical protein
LFEKVDGVKEHLINREVKMRIIGLRNRRPDAARETGNDFELINK